MDYKVSEYNRPVGVKPQEIKNYQNQQHVFYRISVGTEAVTNKSFYAAVPFKVQRVRFDFSYVVKADNIVNYLVTSDLTNNELVGNLNRYSHTVAADYYSVDGFAQDKTIDYIFKTPVDVAGAINLTFNNLTTTTTVTSADVVVHVEFLG